MVMLDLWWLESCMVLNVSLNMCIGFIVCIGLKCLVVCVWI